MTVEAGTFKDWLCEKLDEGEREDLARHGADAGWPGLTYYSDTCALYDRFADEIWDAIYEDAQSFGQTNLELIASFNCAGDVGSDAQFKNMLVWFMAERVARELTGA